MGCAGNSGMDEVAAGKEQWKEPRYQGTNENGYHMKKWQEPKTVSLLNRFAEGQSYTK